MAGGLVEAEQFLLFDGKMEDVIVAPPPPPDLLISGVFLEQLLWPSSLASRPPSELRASS